MKVIVAGAAGGIGRVVSRAFAEAGDTVIGIDRVARPPDFKGKWVLRNLAQDTIERDVFDGVDAVVHLAAVPGRGGVSDRELFINNSATTYSLLEAACEAGVNRMVVASSISIYGTVWADREIAPAEIPLRETSEIRPAEAYALAKEVDEAIARMMCRRFDVSVVLLRLPRVTGVDHIVERSELVAANPSEGHKELWAYLTTDDAAEAFRRAAMAELVGCHVITVTSPQPLNAINVAEAAREFYPDTPNTLKPGEPGFSIEAARILLDFTAKTVIDS